MKNAAPSSRAQVLTLYRRVLRAIRNLQPTHQKIYYDLTRLKLEEHKDERNAKVISELVAAGHEEVSWVESVIQRKASRTPRQQSS